MEMRVMRSVVWEGWDGLAPRTMVAQTRTSLPRMAKPLTRLSILPGPLPRLYMGHASCRHARPLTFPFTRHRSL